MCGGGGPGEVSRSDMFSTVRICITAFSFLFCPVCLFIMINLNAFDIALTFSLHVGFNSFTATKLLENDQ